MKKIVTIIALLFAFSVYAQEPPKFKLEGKTFVQQVENNDIPTEFTYTDKEGNTYPIYLHQYTTGEKKGQYTSYIFKISKKTGNQYKYYLPKEITDVICASSQL